MYISRSQRRAWSLHLRRTSGGTKAIAAAVICQTSMNLGDSDVIVKNRDKTSRKDEDDAFAGNFRCPVLEPLPYSSISRLLGQT